MAMISGQGPEVRSLLRLRDTLNVELQGKEQIYLRVEGSGDRQQVVVVQGRFWKWLASIACYFESNAYNLDYVTDVFNRKINRAQIELDCVRDESPLQSGARVACKAVGEFFAELVNDRAVGRRLYNSAITDPLFVLKIAKIRDAAASILTPKLQSGVAAPAAIRAPITCVFEKSVEILTKEFDCVRNNFFDNLEKAVYRDIEDPLTVQFDLIREDLANGNRRQAAAKIKDLGGIYSHIYDAKTRKQKRQTALMLMSSILPSSAKPMQPITVKPVVGGRASQMSAPVLPLPPPPVLASREKIGNYCKEIERMIFNFRDRINERFIDGSYKYVVEEFLHGHRQLQEALNQLSPTALLPAINELQDKASRLSAFTQFHMHQVYALSLYNDYIAPNRCVIKYLKEWVMLWRGYAEESPTVREKARFQIESIFTIHPSSSSVKSCYFDSALWQEERRKQMRVLQASMQKIPEEDRGAVSRALYPERNLTMDEIYGNHLHL